MAARRAFAASAVLYAAVVLAGALVLPERVPLHFGPDGTPDRFGTRSELLVTEAGVGLGVVALLGLAAMAARRVPLAVVSVPHPEHWKTPEHEPELRRRMEADTLHLGTATMLLLTAASALTAHAGATGAERLGPTLGLLVAAYVAGALAWCVRLARVRYRPPADAPPQSPVTRS